MWSAVTARDCSGRYYLVRCFDAECKKDREYTDGEASVNELTISLDVKSQTPLYEQIYKYIKSDIQNGGLPFRKRLPSTRKLAKYLQVSRTTVDLAYEQLVSEGYIEAIPCKGYFVCDLEGLYRLRTVPAVKKEMTKKAALEYEYDFSPNGVDLNSFPHNAWRKLSKEVLLEENRNIFQLGDPQGEMELRHTIAEYLHQARAVEAEPEQIVVGAGNDFLLLLLCSLFGTGQKIAMESPTYKKAYDVFRNLSNQVQIVEMDESGMRIDLLQKTESQIVYVMPSHQFPLGNVMPVKRRMQLLSWAAEEEGRYIIEDDYDSEFRYKGKPIPALQGYDRFGRVIYIGTFSRSVAPAIRVSYLVLPKALLSLYRTRGSVISSTVSRVDQRIIAGFLNGGYYERHLNKMRAIYKNRHDVLLEELKGFRAICTVSGENAGVHLLLTFTDGRTEQEAIERAAQEGVRVYGLSRYYVGEAVGRPSSTVILGYANLSEDEIRAAVRKLKHAWIEQVPDPYSGNAAGQAAGEQNEVRNAAIL